MQLTELLGADRAVSPVYGVVLVAAIVVVMAAVVGSFAFGVDSTAMEPPSPNAEFDISFEPTDGNYTVTATHVGGEAVPAVETVTLSGPNDSVSFEGRVAPGDSVSLPSVPPGEGVRVVWTSSDGEDSQVLAEESTPS